MRSVPRSHVVDCVINMRVFVKVSSVCMKSATGRSYAVPCKELSASVGTLKLLALDHWSLDTDGEKFCGDADRFQLSLSSNGALLSNENTIGDVLRDGEFVNLCKALIKLTLRLLNVGVYQLIQASKVCQSLRQVLTVTQSYPNTACILQKQSLNKNLS